MPRKPKVLPLQVRSFATTRTSLEHALEMTSEPVVTIRDMSTDPEFWVDWKAYRRETVPVFTYQIRTPVSSGLVFVLYTDAKHPDGRIAFPAEFLEMAESGKRVVFTVNDSLGMTYVIEAARTGVTIIREAKSVSFLAEMAYMRHVGTEYTHLADGTEWMYKIR